MEKQTGTNELVRKNLDISEEAVKVLTIEGIQKGFPNFKVYAQHLLEQAAQKAKAKQS